MEEIGYVKSVNGEYASVLFQRKSGCGGNCGSCKGGCASNLVSTEIKNTLNASKGDKILVSIEPSIFSKMIFRAYILPTIMTILGLIIGIELFKNAGFKSYELFGALVGFTFMAVAFIISGKIDKKTNKNNSDTLKMVKILN
jgi:sigma-E factor negative regulatory protein RseC